jgi:spore coat protein A, manganese oxidase
MSPRILALTCILLVPAPLWAQENQVTLVPSKDNTLYQTVSGYLSNGSGDHFFAGKTNDLLYRRGLVAFDLAAIPPGSTITAVSLRLNMSRTRAQAKNVGLHLVFSDWGEGASNAGGEEGGGAPPATGDATWAHRFYPGSSWSTPGGDFAGAASATTLVNREGVYTWTSAQMAVDVQAWLDAPSTNFGWLVKGEEPGTNTKTTKRFDSRSHPTPANRPQLTITFTAPVSTGACCLSDGACVVTTATGCAGQGGTYQGDGSPCSPSPCPQPTGACCLADGACVVTSAASCSGQGGAYQGDGSPCSPNPCPVILEPFVDPLPRPAVAVPFSGSPGGAADYVLSVTEFEQALHRDLPPTTVWGYGGTYPGPTIEAGAGLPVTVRWENDLRDSTGAPREHHYLPVDLCPHGPDTAGDAPRTVVHLHGGHVEAASDGYPEDTTLPGEANLYVYPNLQLPATLWYHDHAIGITRLNVMMGLAGFYLLRDPFEQALGLPAGAYEVPLAIQDRSFAADGSLEYPAAWEEDFFGDTILVNGKVWPFLDVARGKYRFRVLNGSNSRTYELSLSNGATFHQIGTDGGLLAAPVPLTLVRLSPGERADLVVDFAPYAAGTEILLMNSAPAPYPGTPGVGVVPEVMKFVVTAAGGTTAPLPATLRPPEILQETAAHEHRTLELRKQTDPCSGSIWLIDGLRWHDVTEYPVLGDTEVWSFVNRSGETHPMHLHLVMSQILDRQDFAVVDGQIVPLGSPQPPAPNEAGWKDTFQAPPMQITRVITRFEDYTGRYPYHCHILEHEDQEMMRQFQVTPAKVRRPVRPPTPTGARSP